MGGRILKITMALAFVTMLSSLRAVILFRTGDPDENMTTPTGTLANSGWQYEGTWGPFLGTPIAPHFFISASHIGNAGGGGFNFLGTNYTVLQQFADPFSDFSIWQVQETFPSFAPLYSTRDEVGRHLVVIGRGTQRGSAVLVNNSVQGWGWGTGDGVERWGENIVASIYSNGPLDDLIYATFDQNGLTNEAHLSGGDSGGALFIQAGGVWKLAGINFAVDSPFSYSASGASPFNAALFDMRGLYLSDDGTNYTLVTGANPVPSGFYCTRISAKLDWIYAVTDPTGDFDGDGTPNELEFALHLNEPLPPGLGLTSSANGAAVSVVYRKLLTADLQYQLENSSNLQTWTSAASQDSVLATAGNVQTIQSTVVAGSAPTFLRLRITVMGSVTNGRAVYKTGSAQ